MGVTISTMADTHFPARDRLNHSAALPPQYCYVPPTPNNFAPKGTIYDGYEAFKAQNTPALYRFSTTFQDRAAPEYPHSVEAHEDAIRKLQNDFSAVTGKSLRETSLRLADFTPLNASMPPAGTPRNAMPPMWQGREALELAAQRAGHDLIQPGATSFVERPVNPYFKRCIDDSWANGPGPESMEHPYYDHRMAMEHAYHAHPHSWGFVPNVPGPSADSKPQVHHALVVQDERALFGEGMPWWNWQVNTDQPLGMPTKAKFHVIEDESGLGGMALFKGTLRDNLKMANMDGWASVRSADTWLDLSALSGVEMAVRGDGKTYRFIVRTRDTRGTIEYTAVIPAKASAHQWRTVQLSWDEFRPSYKAGMIAGIELDNVPPLNPCNIKSFGLAVGDRQWGQFHLECAYIKAFN